MKKHLAAISAFAFLLAVFLIVPQSAQAGCTIEQTCNWVTFESQYCSYEDSEGQTYSYNCTPDSYEVCTGTEVCIDVNDYQEGVNDGSARIGDVCTWEREGCFNKERRDWSSGQGNISWYNNNVTFINGERVSESRINDSGGRYWGEIDRLRITDSALWGLWKTGTTDEWILPPNDWNVFGGDGGGEWWGGGGGGGGWGPPPPPPPASVDLRVNGVDSLGSPLEFPASFTLSWTSANADSCSASGDWSGGKATGGSESFSDIPRGTYSYTLNCSGPGGSGSDSVSFQVVQVPRCTLFANPVQIVRPQQSTLSWTCQYADSCSIDNGVGSVNNVSGAANVSPIQSTLYSLTCGGLDGSRSFSAMVSVFVSGLKEVLPR